MTTNPWRRRAWVGLLLSASVIAVWGFSHQSWWQRWPAGCRSGACFCESLAPTAPYEPINTYTSLAYVLAGLLIIFSSSRVPRTSRVFGAALIVLGFASSFYHATLTDAGQLADVFGLYAVGLVVVWWALSTWARLPRRWHLAIMAVLSSISVYLVIFQASIRREWYAGLLVLAVTRLAYLWWRRRSFRLGVLLASVACLSLGAMIWSLDEQHHWCRQLSWVQGHAWWHIFGAAAAYGMARIMQTLPSESPRE